MILNPWLRDLADTLHAYASATVRTSGYKAAEAMEAAYPGREDPAALRGLHPRRESSRGIRISALELLGFDLAAGSDGVENVKA